jgi:hypothetical protein
MPAEFNNCVKEGGRIRTILGPNKQMGLGKEEYVHICVLKGKVIRGEVNTKKTEG